VAISLAAFTLLYGFLAAVEGYLMLKLVRLGPPADATDESENESPSTLVMSF
jgi:cytochrome bd-type quinol oxidase subunit 1